MTAIRANMVLEGCVGSRESAKEKASECANASASTAADPHLTGRPSYIRSSMARAARGVYWYRSSSLRFASEGGIQYEKRLYRRASRRIVGGVEAGRASAGQLIMSPTYVSVSQVDFACSSSMHRN